MQLEETNVSVNEPAEAGSPEKNEYHFACDGKCRICPFPGVNCRKTNLDLKEKSYE